MAERARAVWVDNLMAAYLDMPSAELEARSPSCIELQRTFRHMPSIAVAKCFVCLEGCTFLLKHT